MQEITYWVNGEFVPASKAMMPLNQRGYRLGDAVFDTERTFGGRVFRLTQHLERLARSLAYTRIAPGLSMQELGRITEETVARNQPLVEEYGDFWVTQTISRGGGPPTAPGPGFASVIMEPLLFERVAEHYTQGVPLVIPSVRASASGGLDPKVKCVSRMHLVLADIEAKTINSKALGLLLDEHGDLAEVLYGNIFVVKGGRIATPEARAILEGVTRNTTLELIRETGLPLSERRLQPYDLHTADEAFVTTTSYCLMPVGSLNGQPIGAERPGPVTRELMQGWNRLAGFDIAEQARTYAARRKAAPLAIAGMTR
ncbi:MAG: aminotransferase class IV [Candidatus Lambdaproteobacteria bacterium]|nr:aminotransferase class IV [Candidatus Lambdaproteobacteria bacterium]